MENKFKRFLSLLLAFVMVLGMIPTGHIHAHAEEATYPLLEKVTSIQEGETYAFFFAGTNRCVYGGTKGWGGGKGTGLNSGDRSLWANDNGYLWTLEAVDGGYKIRSVENETYVKVWQDNANLVPAEEADVFTFTHTDSGFVIKANDVEYGYFNNLGDTKITGGWNSDGTKYDIYKVVDKPDPYGKLRGLWKKVSVDTETVYNAQEGKFEYAWDNNPGSHWHSNWQGVTDKLTGNNTFTGVIDLGQAYTINRFYFTPRTDRTGTGIVTQASLYVRASEGDEWVTAAEHATFAATNSKKVISFPAQSVRYVKFVAEQSNDGWVTISEFDVDYSTTVPVEDMTLSAGSHQPNNNTEGAANLAVDNNFNTMWHTNWNGAAAEDLWIQFELPEGYTVTALRYKPREGAKNGTITKYEIRVSTDGQNFETIKTGDWAQNDEWKTAEFVTTAKYIRLFAVESVTDQPGKNFASAAEIILVGGKEAHEHSYSEEITKEATCTEAGEKTLTCACGDTKTEEIPATGHNYESVVTAPTCTEAGYTTYTCACGDTYTEAGEAAKGHSYEVTDEKAATCTEAGYTTYTCSCGDTYTEEIKATGHSYESVVTAPTCTEAGYTTYTCACGDTYTEAGEAAKGHSYEVTDEKAATCTEDGYVIIACSVCGDSYTKTVDAEGHTAAEAVKENEVAPTLNSTGSYDNVVYCSVCNAELSRETVDVPTLTGAAAEIDGYKYATFEEALEAAEEGDTIKLLKEVVVTADTTYDLEGITVESQGDVFVVTSGATLTLNGNGTVKGGTSGVGSWTAVWANGGHVVINGGTYSVGGDINSPDPAHQNDVIYTKNGGTVTINGGTFLYTEGVWTLNENDANRNTITVKGGTFEKFNPADNASEGANTNFVAEGYCSREANGSWTVYNEHSYTPEYTAPTFEADGYTTYTCACGHSYTVTDDGTKLVAVAAIGETKYATFEEALEAAKAGDTIVLLSDAGIKITDDTTYDLTGITVESEGDVFVVTAGTLTLEGGEIKAGLSGVGSWTAVWANGGNVVINGGTYSVGGDTSSPDPAHQNDVIYTKNGGTVTIKGGTFLYTEGVWTLNENDANRGTITVYGGTFEKFDPANNTSEGANTNFVAEGYCSVLVDGNYVVAAHVEGEVKVENEVAATLNSTGSYDNVVYCTRCNTELKRETVPVPALTGAVAEVNGYKYATFEEALEAAKAGEVKTIILLSKDGIEITAGTTYDLTGITVKSQGDVFVVRNGATLTLNGNGTVMGGTTGVGSWTAVWADGGHVVINGGTYSVGGDTSSPDPAHQNDVIYTKNGGTVTIKGGTFLYTEGVWTLNENDANRGTITVYGGTFEKFDPANNTSEGANTNFVAEGYCSALENGNYVVAKHVAGEVKVENEVAATLNSTGSYDNVVYCTRCNAELKRETVPVPALTGAVAEVNGYKYATFEEALEAAKAGEVKTIVLLSKDGIEITAETTYDLTGITVKSEGDVFVVRNDATLTLNGNGTVMGGTTGVGSWTAVWADGGHVVINGGTYSVGGDTSSPDPAHQNDVIYTKNGGTVTINGGTFLHTEGVWTLNKHDSTGGAIVVTGGTFQNWNPAENKEATDNNFVAEGYCSALENGNYVVAAHKYTAVVTDPTCEGEGYTTHTCSRCGNEYVDNRVDALGHTAAEAVKENEVPATETTEGSYDMVVYCSVCGVELSRKTETIPVQAAFVAEVNGTGYTTLTGAIAAAKAGDTITFLADITENVTINKSVTIDGADKTYTGTMTGNKGLTITIQNVKFVNGGFDKAKSQKSSTGTYTIKNCTFVDDGNFNYPVRVYGANKLVVENCTVSGYKYSFLYVVSAVNTVSVKNVTVENCPDYAVYFASGVNNATFENLTVKNSNNGFVINNTANRSFTIKDCKMENVGTAIAHSKGTMAITCTAQGTNDFGTAVLSEYAKIVLAENATLAAPEGLNVITDAEGYEVIYKGGIYSLCKHEYEAVVTEPTCEAEGYTTYTCKNCGKSYTADETAARNHAWGEASYTDNGDGTHTATYTCGNDEAHTKSEAPVVHTYENGECVCGAKEPVVNPVAQIGETKFATLAEAIAAAKAGDTIVFLADITENVTINKSVTIDGADKIFTGKMTLTKGAITIKNVNFVGTDEITYAVENSKAITSLTIEDCTAKNYSYGFLQMKKSNNKTVVKNVTVSDVNYGIKIDYSNAVVLENVTINAADAGLLNSDYAAKTITIKNSSINTIKTWARTSNYVTTYIFKGENTVGQFAAYIDNTSPKNTLKLAEVNATLAAPAGLTVITDVEDHEVAYANGVYSVVKMAPAVAQIGETQYKSLQAAVEAAKNGDVITVIADHEIACGAKSLVEVAGKAITIDLNGKTITVNAAVECGTRIVFEVASEAELIMKDSVGTGAVIANGDDQLHYMFRNEGKMTIESGSYTLSAVDGGAMFFSTNDGMKVTGGTFTQLTTGWMFNTLHNGVFDIIVSGGTYNRYFIGGADFGENPWVEVKLADGCELVDNNNGTWTVNPKPAEPELFKLYGANMDLGNKLDMNFYFLKQYITDEESYAVITKEYADGTVVTKTFNYNEFGSQSKDLYRISFEGIAAKEMADTITVTIYDGDGNAISEVWTDSVRDYSMRMLEKATTDVERTLFVDMLNYGTAAQMEFDYNEDDYANSKLTDEQQNLATNLDSLKDYSNFDKSYYYGANMDLESSIKFNMYFLRSKVTSDMKMEISYTDHQGVAHNVEVLGSQFHEQSKDLYKVTVDGLVVADVEQIITVVIKDAEGNDVTTIVESIESYLARRDDSSDLYKAIMKFGLSANEYLHRNDK